MKLGVIMHLKNKQTKDIYIFSINLVETLKHKENCACKFEVLLWEIKKIVEYSITAGVVRWSAFIYYEYYYLFYFMRAKKSNEKKKGPIFFPMSERLLKIFVHIYIHFILFYSYLYLLLYNR